MSAAPASSPFKMKSEQSDLGVGVAEVDATIFADVGGAAN
jgi:hypothetical protein